jgi:hypothetical protein
MTKKRAQLMSEDDLAVIENASDEVSDLTLQGYSPTDAIAKVASAYKFPIHKTELLTYAYTNGVAAEKRASAGGPFDRLQSFPVPDPVRIRELVYGKTSEDATDTKTASVDIMSLGMKMFDTDLTGVSPENVREMLGFKQVKTAESEDSDSSKEDKSGHGMSITQTTVRVSLYNPAKKKEADGRYVHKIPETTQEHLDAGLKMMSPELSNEIDSILSRFINNKSAEVYKARAEADDAYHSVYALLGDMDRHIKARNLTPSFKAAGLASINAYYPDVAKILAERVGEVDAYLIKTAEYLPTDVSAAHPWVFYAKQIYETMEKTAELNVEVQLRESEYAAASYLYNNRPRYKAADWMPFTKDADVESWINKFVPKGVADAAAVAKGVKSVGGSMFGFGGNKDDKSDKKKHDIYRSVASDMYSPSHTLNLKDIEVKNMLNDFAVNDEILSAFPINDILKGYNDLLRTAPSTMRTKAQARALLQQYMTQGRMAPTELMPALQMNKLTGNRKDSDSSDNSGKV